MDDKMASVEAPPYSPTPLQAPLRYPFPSGFDSARAMRQVMRVFPVILFFTVSVWLAHEASLGFRRVIIVSCVLAAVLATSIWMRFYVSSFGRSHSTALWLGLIAGVAPTLYALTESVPPAVGFCYWTTISISAFAALDSHRGRLLVPFLGASIFFTIAWSSPAFLVLNGRMIFSVLPLMLVLLLWLGTAAKASEGAADRISMQFQSRRQQLFAMNARVLLHDLRNFLSILDLARVNKSSANPEAMGGGMRALRELVFALVKQGDPTDSPPKKNDVAELTKEIDWVIRRQVESSLCVFTMEVDDGLMSATFTGRPGSALFILQNMIAAICGTEFASVVPKAFPITLSFIRDGAWMRIRLRSELFISRWEPVAAGISAEMMRTWAESRQHAAAESVRNGFNLDFAGEASGVVVLSIALHS